jgi:alcohol dehydrogenase, propanol-preferring
VGIDSRPEPLNLARSLKYAADLLIHSSTYSSHEISNAIEEINKLHKPNSLFSGLDAVIVATGANEAFDFGIELLRKHGKLIVVGQPSEKIGFTSHQFIFRDITVIGTLVSDLETCREMVDLVATKGIEVKTKAIVLLVNYLTCRALNLSTSTK